MRASLEEGEDLHGRHQAHDSSSREWEWRNGGAAWSLTEVVRKTAIEARSDLSVDHGVRSVRQ